MDGPPSWCMVVSMTCPCCRRCCWANDGGTLTRIPAFAAATYPVESKHALQKNCHIGRDATQVFDMLMTTCGNGDLCSRLLHNAINRAHLERITNCCLHSNTFRGSVTRQHIEKDRQHVRAYPPLGDAIRETHDDASSSNNTPWRITAMTMTGMCSAGDSGRQMRTIACQRSCS